MSDNTNAERQRRWRERQKAKKPAADAAEPIHYERPDWRLFIDKRTLPQKAGCALSQIGRVVLKELVDNALDAGAGDVTLTGDAKSCTVSDDGPGIAPFKLPRLFAVNRPLISSKLKRVPTRGMLGNGLRVVMGAVAALDGTISVTTRGRRYDLGVDTVTGETKVFAAADVPAVRGVQPKPPRLPILDDDIDPFASNVVTRRGPRGYFGG